MIIGISGGTGSGKTTVANRILESVSASEVVFIQQDSYYLKVIEQYVATVRPMHMQLVEPSKRYADVIIPEGGHNLVSIDLISGKIRERLAGALTRVGGRH